MPLPPSRQLEQPYQRQASHPLALEREPYALRPWEAIKLACRRQMALMAGDKTMIRGRIGQVPAWELACCCCGRAGILLRPHQKGGPTACKLLPDQGSFLPALCRRW
jgi:hypothetical protein